MKNAACTQCKLVLAGGASGGLLVLSIFNLLLTRLSSTSGSDVELGRQAAHSSVCLEAAPQVRYAQARSVTSRARSIMTPYTCTCYAASRDLHRCSSSQSRMT